MTLSLLDWLAIAGYLAITLLLGFWFRKRSAQSVDDYFVSGRTVNWWLAGTSMVATTFAADTPLVVTGLVYAQGISGNWLWWGSLFSGMMTVFLFARLWRRSGLLTDVQFAELRYSGRPAAFLRGFRAVYLGLLMNCVILGWVTKAMTSIVSTTLGGTPLLLTVGRWVLPLGGIWAGHDGAALAVCVLFLIPFTGLYVSLGGLWGVLWTDLFQFVLKMSIVIAIAFYAVRAVGGMPALIARLGLMRTEAMRTNPAGDPLAVQQPPGVRIAEPKRRQVHERRIDRQQWRRRPALRQCLQRLEGVERVPGEGLHVPAAQAGHVPHGAERDGDLLGQHPHVRALGAQDLQIQVRGCKAFERQGEDLDLPRCAWHAHTRPCQPIQRLSALLDGGIHRRHLLARTQEALQHRRDVRRTQGRHGKRFGEGAFGIAARRRAAEGDAEAIALAPREDVAGHLGGLPQADRQHAGRERIEAADVTALDASEEPAHALQGRVRGQAEGLVEQQHAAGHHGKSSAPGRVGVGRRLGACLVGAILGDGLIDEACQACGVRGAVVEHELQARRMAQSEPPAEFPAQESGRARESLLHLLVRAARGKGREEDLRRAHVGGHAHARDGHVAHARILHLARDQAREHALDLRLDALRARLGHYCSVLATSTRE
jgi:hypothetical protein